MSLDWCRRRLSSLAEMLERGKVAQGGFALFQVPTYLKHYSFTLSDYVSRDTMQMHPLP